MGSPAFGETESTKRDKPPAQLVGRSLWGKSNPSTCTPPRRWDFRPISATLILPAPAPGADIAPGMVRAPTLPFLARRLSNMRRCHIQISPNYRALLPQRSRRFAAPLSTGPVRLVADHACSLLPTNPRPRPDTASDNGAVLAPCYNESDPPLLRRYYAISHILHLIATPFLLKRLKLFPPVTRMGQ